MTSTRLRLLLAALVGLLVLSPTAALAAEASITEDGVDPDPISVDVDEVVTFTNDTDDDIRLVDDDGRWDSGDLVPGQQFSLSFPEEGVITFSTEDGAITGTILVGDVEAPADDATEDDATEDDAAATEDDDADEEAAPVASDVDTGTDAGPTGLADTGLPAAGLAWLAAGLTLGGAVAVGAVRPRRS